MKKHFFFLLAFFLFQNGFSQQPEKWNSSEIYQAIEKLNFLGSVLYIAAHPDDENTQLISYFSNEVNARTAYLSLTRGDGGQNLIGPEIRELLGVIRTQELLSARNIDGGIQFFTRANDFGYSKTPKETLEIWNENEVLSDVVWTIRNFRPDVIINRFDLESAGETHGHHTSSAILSAKSFDLAGEKNEFPEQLRFVETWQPKRLFFNTSWWFYGSREKFKKAMERSDFLSLDVGVYYPLQGLSNTEISALSRSQHRSQGFGVAGSRGSEMEYLELVKGQFPENEKNVFAGINTTWSRLKNGEPIGKMLSEVQKNYNFKNPAASVPKLMEAYELIQNLENEHWKKIKSRAIEKIVLAAMGVYLEVAAENETAVPGEKIKISIEAINRSEIPVRLEKVRFSSLGTNISPQKKLMNNQGFVEEKQLQLPKTIPPTSPYWLNEKASLGMYHVEKQKLIGLPETPSVLTATFDLSIDGIPMNIEKPIVYKTTEPAKGEVYKTFSIVPKVAVSVEEEVIIFKDGTPKNIGVAVKAFQDGFSGDLSLLVPENWKVSPKSKKIRISSKNAEKTVFFQVTPPKNQAEGFISPTVVSEGEKYSKELISFDYPHIPKQSILRPAKAKVVRLDIRRKGNRIAYIEGAGDVVAESLRQIGYSVEVFSPAEITTEKLSNFDAVVIGIRAYNTEPTLDSKQEILFDFVKNGGNMIVQYNTSHRLKTDNLAPYELQLSRDRVTDEHSEVVFLAENHPVLNTPNKITKNDFQGWVQERGLYFPDNWGKEFTPILGMKDNGEPLRKGSLLVAKYGEGYYIYTGLSFFREFPAGVSGAYRLFANLLSLGK
ncbi:MAG TPA: PIG-L family deacetylase [Flavobacteriaceae bacterium]|nr:PIG-L family deacetylase [Flavobacteriaceae bacterium]